eukprot:s245_g15.t1
MPCTLTITHEQCGLVAFSTQAVSSTACVTGWCHAMRGKLPLVLSVGLIWCLHFVAGSTCLENVVTVRKDLVNANGESYPVGLAYGNWASAKVLAEIVRIVLEEIVGYNAQRPESGYSDTVASFRALFGCTNPADSSDNTGCSDGDTRSHVMMEYWSSGYVLTFNSLVEANPNFAAFRASNLFNGLEGMYISKAVWEQKTAAPLLDTKEALHEDQQPWTYFDAISAFDTSKLMPCTSTLLMDKDIMASYLKVTGDTAGVYLKPESLDEYAGVCHANHWWLAPGECRTSSGLRCVPWITGGNGWNLEQYMQKATVWQIPLAIGVASDWTAFTELPKTMKHLLYWWEPDTTFAALEPKYVTFPAHNATAWFTGNLTTTGANSMIENLVSYDLPDLAPDVYGFVHNFEMSMDTMRGIMRDVASGTTVEEAACGWTKQNEDVLRNFIPDTTESTTGSSVQSSATTTADTSETIPEVDVEQIQGAVTQALQNLTSAQQAFLREQEKLVVGSVTVVKLQVSAEQTEPVVYEFGDREGEPSGTVVSLPPSLISQLQSEGDVMLTVSKIDQTVQEQLTAAAGSGTSNLVVNAPVIEISLFKVNQGEVGKADVSSTPAPIVFKLQDAEPGPNDVCVYFDLEAKSWSSSGLVGPLSATRVAELFSTQWGGTWCEANHLTIFSVAEQVTQEMSEAQSLFRSFMHVTLVVMMMLAI